jgi:hypothetical protein
MPFHFTSKTGFAYSSKNTTTLSFKTSAPVGELNNAFNANLNQDKF